MKKVANQIRTEQAFVSKYSSRLQPCVTVSVWSGGGSGLLQAQKYIPVFPSEIIGEKITQ